MTGHSDKPGLEMLASALHNYLEEIASYHQVCSRHANTAAVHEQHRWLMVARTFANTDPLRTHLRKVIDQQPSWEKSAEWPVRGATWWEFAEGFTHRGSSGADMPLSPRGFLWEGLPLLGVVWDPAATGEFVFRLALPPLGGDLPELPLRRVARLLQAHENLIPSSVAEPLSLAQQDATSSSVKGYLSRTMDRRLYASRCLFQEP